MQRHLIVLTRPEAKNQYLASSLFKLCKTHFPACYAASFNPQSEIQSLESTEKILQILSLPALTLAPCTWHELTEREKEVCRDLHQFNAVFCVSTHAVEYFFQLLEKQINYPQNDMVSLLNSYYFLCVGEATQQYLLQRGVESTKIVVPENGNDSESLLNTLLKRALLNKLCRVLIVRAKTGRDWLQEQLQQYGIRVDTLSVYRRESTILTTIQQQFFKDLPKYTDFQWLFTSSESVEALLPQLHTIGVFDEFIKTICAKTSGKQYKHHFWVIHQRIAQMLQQCLAQLGGIDPSLFSKYISVIPAENIKISKSIVKHLNIIG